MFSASSENSWRPRRAGQTLGTRGPDNGIITRDEEYGRCAQITLERNNPTAPYALIFSVLGILLVTEYYPNEAEAQSVFDDLKGELGHICELSQAIGDAEAEQLMDRSIEVLARRFGFHL